MLNLLKLIDMDLEHKLIMFRATELVLKAKELERLTNDLESYRTNFIANKLPEVIKAIDECIDEIVRTYKEEENE